MQATKQSIIAPRVALERYIRSTHPALYISGRRDFQGSGKFLSEDAYGHVATVTGALWTPQGYDLDGVDDYIDCGNNPIMDFTTGDYTILARVKPDTLTGQHHIFIRGLDAQDGYRFWLNSGQINSTTYQAGAAQTSSSDAGIVVTDTWCLVATTRSGASVKVFKNGLDVTTSIATHIDPVTSTETAQIGRYTGGGSLFDGLIALVCIYNRALRAVELSSIYQLFR